MILADTDVLIDHIRGISAVTRIIDVYARDDQLRTTAVNCFELMSGAEGKRGDRIRDLLDAVPGLPLDQEAAAARIRTPIGGYIGGATV